MVRGFQKLINHMFNKDIMIPKSINKDTYHFFSPIDAIIPPKTELEVDTGIKVIFPSTEALSFTRDNHLILDHKVAPNKKFLTNEFDAILTLFNPLDKEIIVNKGDILCKAFFERI